MSGPQQRADHDAEEWHELWLLNLPRLTLHWPTKYLEEVDDLLTSADQVLETAKQFPSITVLGSDTLHPRHFCMHKRLGNRSGYTTVAADGADGRCARSDRPAAHIIIAYKTPTASLFS